MNIQTHWEKYRAAHLGEIEPGALLVLSKVYYCGFCAGFIERRRISECPPDEAIKRLTAIMEEAAKLGGGPGTPPTITPKTPQ